MKTLNKQAAKELKEEIISAEKRCRKDLRVQAENLKEFSVFTPDAERENQITEIENYLIGSITGDEFEKLAEMPVARLYVLREIIDRVYNFKKYSIKVKPVCLAKAKKKTKRKNTTKAEKKTK